MFVIVMQIVVQGKKLNHPLAVCDSKVTAEREAQNLNSVRDKSFSEYYWVKAVPFIKANQEGDQNV